MEFLQKILDDWEFQLHRVSTLVVSLLAANIMLISVVMPWIGNYLSDIKVDILIMILVSLAISGVWYWNRTTYPKGAIDKQNFIIAITTEDKKQKTRIATDFTNEIKRQLNQYGLSHSFDVVVLHNHLADSIQTKIARWIESMQAGMVESEDVLRFRKIVNRLNARFFVYGNLIQRNAGNSTYCLNIEALILHGSAHVGKTQELRDEFVKLWKREITFLEEDELNGFKSNANHIFFTATYMIGLATFVDNRYDKGIEIWEKLERYVQDRDELQEFESKILRLKAASYFMQSRLLHYQGEIEESVRLRERYLELFPHEYDRHITESIRLINRGNVDLALEHLEQAKKYAGTDGTWKYNKFYTLIYAKRCDEALETLDDILSQEFQNEQETISQVLSYNKNCLDEDEQHIQSYFIVGVLLYKKFQNPTSAYENLESFIEEASRISDFYPLVKRTKSLLSEINLELKIS
jgi:tetratricopeptide (TPR) repeat protein